MTYSSADAMPLPVRATPPLSALQAFERAACHRSFQRAAAELAVTPSAISHQIRGLERYFGERLFVREGRAVSLTAEGELLLADVRAGLLQLDRASRRLLMRRGMARDRLRVSVAPGVAHTLLFARLAEFEALHPSWRLSLDNGAGEPGAEPVEADVTIQLGRAGAGDMRLLPLLEVRPTPVAAPTRPVRDLDDPDQLLRQRLIHVRREPNAWNAWLASAGASGRAVSELWVDSVAAALDAAEQGVGVALAPYPLILARRSGPRRLRALAPACRVAGETIYLARRADRRDDRRVVAFTSWLTSIVADLVSRADACRPQPARAAA